MSSTSTASSASSLPDMVYSKSLPIGKPVPELKLKLRSWSWSLESAEPYQGLMVLLTCNHCPEARQAWPLVIEQHWRYRHQVAFLAVNAASETSPLETMDETEALAVELQLRFPYLPDPHGTIAAALQGSCMPEAFLFQHQGPGLYTLYYHGAVNQSWAAALQRLTLNLDPSLLQPRALGCPIPSQVVGAHRDALKNLPVSKQR